MQKTPTGKNILLAVTGSIAAYKAASILRGLMARGHTVQVVMTEAAQKLVSPTTFRALSGRPVATRLFIEESAAGPVHIELAEWADVLAVAPATANAMGKFACGIADEIVSCTWMACDCPKVVAPAMNDRMWASAAVRRNCDLLRETERVRFVGPIEGRLANGRVGIGRLAPVNEIVETIHSVAESA